MPFHYEWSKLRKMHMNSVLHHPCPVSILCHAIISVSESCFWVHFGKVVLQKSTAQYYSSFSCKVHDSQLNYSPFGITLVSVQFDLHQDHWGVPFITSYLGNASARRQQCIDCEVVVTIQCGCGCILWQCIYVQLVNGLLEERKRHKHTYSDAQARHVHIKRQTAPNKA